MPYVYPTNRELTQLGQEKTTRLEATRLGFKYMPRRPVPAGRVEWTIKDNYRGLQQLRGMDGSPASVNRVGTNRYSMSPGIYGEFVSIGEQELTERAGGVVGDVPIDVTDLVMEADDILVGRELDLCEYIIWTLLSSGTFSVSAPGGQIAHTDTYSVQTYAGSDWSTVATATPLADLRAAKLLARGKGVSFGAGSEIVVSQATANYLLNNTNASDLGGKRVEGGNSITTMAEINRILLADDLPQIVIYDEGYISDAGTFTLFVPVDKFILVGKRTSGETVGEYKMTRNLNNPGGAPGSYAYTVDNTGNGTPTGKAPNVQRHRGHNGGPAIYWPSAIVVGSV